MFLFFYKHQPLTWGTSARCHSFESRGTIAVVRTGKISERLVFKGKSHQDILTPKLLSSFSSLCSIEPISAFSFYTFFLSFLSALSFYPGSCSPGLFSFTTCFAKVLFLVVWVEIFLYLSFFISFSDHLNLLLCLILLLYFLLSVLFISCL